MSKQPRTVLIVDDDEDIRDMVSEYLRIEGFETLVASDGKNALNVLESNQPDIALLDVSLPDMSGFKICRMIKEIESMKDMEVVFISGRTALQDRLQGFLSGGKRYICKPFDVEELLESINSIPVIKRKSGDIISPLMEEVGFSI